jgi:hypothetical protein
MAASSHLIALSGGLKRELIEYSNDPRFNRLFQRAMRERLDQPEMADEAQIVNFIDYFILQYKFADGKTLVERFVAAHPELADEERALLLGWQDVVEGIFEVERRETDVVVARNLVDELGYRIHSNAGPSALKGMQPRSFLLARIVPIEDEWLLSGVSRLLPECSRSEAYATASDLALHHPALVFRNPEKLAQGWELQREERRRFIEFFGADLVVVPGSQTAERMRAF